jgi:hypothetical protein
MFWQLSGFLQVFTSFYKFLQVFTSLYIVFKKMLVNTT